MRTVKSVITVIGAFVPVLYCGGLAYHFFGVGGSVQNVQDIGLAPTVVGLGVLGLLFFMAFVWKIARLFSGPRSPGSSGRGGSFAALDDDKDDFDADAAIARYMSQRAMESVPARPTMPSRPKGGGTVKRTGFGRRNS